MTLWAVISDLVRHPVVHFVERWNWKSAVCSATSRGLVFCAMNLGAGPAAGLRALITEFCLRGATAGFYGAATQSLSRAQPPWAGSLCAVVMLPVIAHTAEWFVHHLAGTARIGQSVVASMAFTVMTTLFNSFAMRRGVLTVGGDSRSLLQDLRAMPGVIADFASALPRAWLSSRRTGEA